jgi:CHAP domain
MSIESTLVRVSAIRQAIADPTTLIGAAASAGGTEAPTASAAAASPSLTVTATATPTFASALSGYYGTLGNGGGGARVLAAAESQLGQAEQPPGSNESPAIAEYRGAAAGAAPGEPWCAYFASWAARQAGEPIGPGGEGLGSVSAIWSWAQSAGRAVANGPGVVPRPGDLIVFGDQHVGIVRGVTAGGQIETVEGNYENKVAANVRSASEASGYVSMS